MQNLYVLFNYVWFREQRCPQLRTCGFECQGDLRVMYQTECGSNRSYLCNFKCYIFLRRTSRCVYKLQTNRYNSVKHNHLFFYSGWITCFGLGRPSSGQQMFLFQPYRNNSLPIRSNLPKRNLRGERNAISFTLTSSSKVYLLAIPSYTLSARSRYPPPLRPECDMLTRPALQQSCNRTTANVSTITVKYQSEFQIFLRFAEISCFSLSRRHNPLQGCIHSPLAGFSLFFRGFYITHNDASQSVGLLRTSDQFVKKTST